MYTACLSCNRSLGGNELVERFPVGRKLAFDQTVGRLWVVCVHCGRWNLTPLEERWEAIEQCERLFRSTAMRASTEHIGLAKLTEGLQLVRVGKPNKPELAAWRYGDRLVKRRYTAHIAGGAMVAGMLGVYLLEYANPALYSAIPVAGVIPHLLNYGNLYNLFFRPVATLPAGDGTMVTLRAKDTADLKIEPVGDAGWRLNILHGKGRSILTGHEAQRVLDRVVRRWNGGGGKADTIAESVAALVNAGSAEQFIRQYAERHTRSMPVDVPKPLRLALEMALHEDTERTALEGDLAALEAAWREAEEIAAIADRLLLPSWIGDRVRSLKR